MRSLYLFLLGAGANAEDAADAAAAADSNSNGSVTCNDATGDVPEMKIRLTKDYFESKTTFQANSDDFNFVDDMYEMIISQENLQTTWVDDDCK